MFITSTLLKLGAGVVLARLASRIRMADLQRLAPMGVDDLRRLGLDHADTALGAVGLRRMATMTSGTSLVAGGFIAGAVVGAGTLFLAYTEPGRAVRQQLLNFFGRRQVDHQPVDEPPAAAPSAGGNTHGETPAEVAILTV